jgi:4-aminobutyrate--pyruvate transaminase
MDPSLTAEAEALGSRDLAHVVHPLTRHRQLTETRPVVVVSGEGAEVTLSDGRKMIDGPSGMWCVNVGHGRRELIDAAQRQLEEIAFSPLFGGLSTPATIAFCERLTGLAPGDLDHVFLVNGGSEANETAFKFSRYYWYLKGRPEKKLILSHDRGYHGVTGTAMYATGLEQYHVGYGPGNSSMQHFPTPYAYRLDDEAERDRIFSGQALEERIAALGADQIAAVIIEPVVGSGGVLPPPPGYLKAVREICDRNEILMIADEIITGFGRTGTWFAVEREDVVPDFLTFAKGVSSGYMPLGGTLIRGPIWEVFRDADGDPSIMHGFTTSGHPVACAVASANLDVIEGEGLIAQVNERGRYLGELLEGLRELPEVGDVRYDGLMAAVELVADRETKERFPLTAERAPRISRAARNHGLLVRPLIGDIVFLAPPFIVSEEQLERIVGAVSQAITETAGGTGNGSV